jgi:hypothetical protein
VLARTASPNLLFQPAGRSHAIAQHAGTPKCGPFAREARAVARRRLSDCHPKHPAERAQATEAHVEADLCHRTVGLSQQLHRSLNAPALKVPVWGLAERGPELAAEVRRRYVGQLRQRGNVEALRERPIHRVAGTQHPPVAILDRARHLRQATGQAPHHSPVASGVSVRARRSSTALAFVPGPEESSRRLTSAFNGKRSRAASHRREDAPSVAARRRDCLLHAEGRAVGGGRECLQGRSTSAAS